MIGWIALLVVAVLTVAGCASTPSPDRPAGAPPSSSTAPSGTAPSGTAPSSTAPADFRVVEFPARDGQVRSGRLFGDGEAGVVLSHMGRSGDGQDDWAPFARELAARGYRVLTYENRSRLEGSWQDVLGAADLLAAEGATGIVFAGASIGAMASLRAAREAPGTAVGVLWLAGVRSDSGYDFQQADVAALGCPVLFAAGEDDAYGAAADTRQLAGWAASPELLVVDSIRHGTDILAEDPAAAGELRAAMLAFVERATAAGQPC
ncbi:MAG TPA: hypothetical protein VD903_22165 [Pseudonocardia sp.]|nr:hypothetical protein [Pseudonocardia sp.]